MESRGTIAAQEESAAGTGIGPRLKALRVAAGIGLTAQARAVGMTPANVMGLEKRANLQTDTVLRYVAALGTGCHVALITPHGTERLYL